MAQVAYDMEVAEHRSTMEKLHRAELAARDQAVRHLKMRVIELEDEVRRLRTALQVLTGRPVPGPDVGPAGLEGTGDDDPADGPLPGS
jgi:hypothetical protein